MPTLSDILSAYTPEQQWDERRKVSVKENGKRYCADFGGTVHTAVYKLDGGVIPSTDSRCCDKLILHRSGADCCGILVELKGNDFNHAVTQIEDTLTHRLFAGHTKSIPRARIVCGNIPRNTGRSSSEKSKIRFLKKYGCDLRSVHSGAIEKIYK